MADRVEKLPWWLWLVPAAFLLSTNLHFTYVYYTFLRAGVFSFAALVAWDEGKDGAILRLWRMTFTGIAILFNPVLPIHLNRAAWFYLNVAAAVIILGHLSIVRLKRKCVD